MPTRRPLSETGPPNATGWARQQARIDSAAQARLNVRVAAGEFKGNEAGLCRELASLSNPATFGDPKMSHLARDVCDSPNEWPTRYGVMVQAILASFGDFDWRSSLERASIPRLVIHGDRDNFPVEGARMGSGAAKRPPPGASGRRSLAPV